MGTAPRHRPRAVQRQHPVGLEEVGDGIWSIHFCHVLLGRVDERDYIIRT
jgi:hypothetical protein